MLKEHPRLSRQLAICCDVITAVSAFILAYYFRRFILIVIPFGAPTALSDYRLTMLFIALIWGVSLNIQGAYISQRFTSLRREWKRVVITTVIGTLTLIAAKYTFKLPDWPRSLILLFAGVSAAGLMVEKASLYMLIRWIRRKGYDCKVTLIVGNGEDSREFIRQVEDHPDWGLEIAGFLTIRTEEVGEKIGDHKVIGTTDDFLHILHESVIEEVIIILPILCFDEVQRLIRICEREGTQVRLVSHWLRPTIAKLSVDRLHGLPIMTFSTAPTQEWQLFVKRVVDIFASILGLVLLSPLLLMLTFLIKLTSRAPVFYRWHVIGYNKKPFVGYKFRTMIVGADKLKNQLISQNEMSGPVFKIKNDPRVTPIGRVLRKFSLDELPQLWSVLKGDMSFVGPRPCLVSELPFFESWQRRKFCVKPGLTCLWQASGRNEIRDFNTWANLDLEYIDNWSLWLDFKILLKTIPVVFFGRGSC